MAKLHFPHFYFQPKSDNSPSKPRFLRQFYYFSNLVQNFQFFI